MDRITNPPPLPARPAEGHKGLFGRVLVLAGSEDMLGAPALTGTAALRMGAGLVQVATPKAALPFILTMTPELIGLPLGKSPDLKALLEAAEKADVLAIGPGLGTSPEATSRLSAILKIEKPMVVDADALNILASNAAWPKEFSGNAVLTPHPGEMQRLAKFIGRSTVPDDPAGRIDIAVQLAQKLGQVVVLKGHRTVVTDGEKVFVNSTGNSSLSKAGTGDVLTGIIAALLGQNVDRFEAAAIATYLHGRSGELAAERLGTRSVLARDVIDFLAEAILEYERGKVESGTVLN